MPNFVSVATSIPELAHGEKSHTQSLSECQCQYHYTLLNLVLTHSPSLFDGPGIEAFTSEHSLKLWQYSCKS